jgi:hypothetical protein
MQRQVAKTSFELAREAILYTLEDRIKRLENKVFPKLKRRQPTKGQKILIMYHLGLIEPIKQLDVLQKNKALLVSAMIDEDPENIEKDLAKIGRKDSALRSMYNYKFLVDFFKDLKMEQQMKDCEMELRKISSEKNSIQKR